MSSGIPSLSLPRRYYDTLLRLLPTSFRNEYGGAMRDAFLQQWRDRSGALAHAALLLRALADVARTAAYTTFDTTFYDLRFTVRSLRRAPGFALTATLVTALGIGASSAAFSIADFVLIRPLPFPNPDALVKLWAEGPDGGRVEMSPPNYREFQSSSRSYTALGAYHGLSANLVGEGEPVRVEGTAVTSNLLPILGVSPVAGRLPNADDERAGITNQVVLSYGYWQTAYGGDPGVIGRTLSVNGESRVVIGVMPADFVFPSRRSTLWTVMPREELMNEERDNNWFYVVGRLRDGVTVDQARLEARSIAARLARDYPQEMEKVSAAISGLRDELSQQSSLLLIGLCAASLCVLLIACTNLATLLLARTLARRRELVVRTALGAGRDRLTRQLITESVGLTLVGASLGVLVAMVAVPLLARLIPFTIPVSSEPSVNLVVLAVAGLACAITGVVFGTVPGLRATGVGIEIDVEALREGTRAGTRSRLRSTLVAAQIAASVVLLVGSVLLTRALLRVQSVDPGFRPEGTFMTRTALAMPEYATVAKRERFYRDVLARVRALPGVTDAAYVTMAPMLWGGGVFGVTIPGAVRDRSTSRNAILRFATPGFFRTAGITIVGGRDVAETDIATQPSVAVVSESFVTRYLPEGDPIGKRFVIATDTPTVVGVVRDVRARGLERQSEPQVYRPYLQVGDGSLTSFVPKDLLIRGSTTLDAALPEIRRIVHDADPRQPVSDAQTLETIVDGQTTSRTVQARVVGGFAIAAFLLAAIGIHGLLSFSVTNRRQEIGVRLALGASPRMVLGLIVRQALVLVAAGVLPGVFVAYAAGRAMSALLAGVTPTDLATFGVTIAACATMAVVGSVVPAMRAARVSPATALRGQ